LGGLLLLLSPELFEARVLGGPGSLEGNGLSWGFPCLNKSVAYAPVIARGLVRELNEVGVKKELLGHGAEGRGNKSWMSKEKTGRKRNASIRGRVQA
jgi:hypothetical protein